MLWRNFFIVSILLLTSTSSSATEDNNRVSVFVSYAGDDVIGQRIVSLLEDLIDASPNYKMAPSHEATMKIALASLNLDAGNTGSHAAISTVITMRNYLNYDPAEPQTWYPIFLSSNLVVISSSMADAFAGATLAKIGAALEHYRKDVRKYATALTERHHHESTSNSRK